MPTIAVCIAYATRRKFLNLYVAITYFQWSNTQVCVSPTGIAIPLRVCHEVYVRMMVSLSWKAPCVDHLPVCSYPALVWTLHLRPQILQATDLQFYLRWVILSRALFRW